MADDAIYNVLLNFRTNNSVSNTVNKQLTKTKKSVNDIKSQWEAIWKDNTFQNTDPEVFSNMKRQLLDIDNINGSSKANMDNLNKAYSELMQVERFRNMGVDAEFLNKEIKSISISTGIGSDNLIKLTQSAKKMAKGFDMSKLSMMFFGMAIQKMFLGTFNKMVNTFKMVDKKGLQPITRSITKLQAAFQFMSFTFIQAMEPFLLPVIDGIVTMVDWFSNLNDGWKLLITTGILVIGVLGAIGAIFGSFSLGLGGLGLTGPGGLFSQAGLGEGGKILSGLAGSTLKLGVSLFLAVASLVAVKDGITNFLDGLKTGDVYQSAWGLGEVLGGTLGLGMTAILAIDGALGIATSLKLMTGEATVVAAIASVGKSLGTKLSVAFGVGLLLGIPVAILAGLTWLRANWGSMLTDATFGSGLGPEFERAQMDFYKNQIESGSVYGRLNFDPAARQQFLDDWDDMYAIPTDVTYVDPATFKTAGKQMGQSLAIGAAEGYPFFKSAVDSTFFNFIDQNFTSNSPPKTGPLSLMVKNGEWMGVNFANGLLMSKPFLIETISLVFLEATDVMKDIVHQAVEETISDVNRAIAALKALDARRAKSRLAEKNYAKTTNNNFNISSASGTDISRSIRNANIAVPTRL